MVHSFGAKTMLHSCGSVRAFIPILIDIGLDILDVVHVDSVDMDITDLHRDFNKKLVFCGSISVQSLLPYGTPEDIKKEVEKRKKLFSEGGIIIGPTNIMQVDMTAENFAAMCEAIGCLNAS
jgi:uroporphyrinogen decarboxylase